MRTLNEVCTLAETLEAVLGAATNGRHEVSEHFDFRLTNRARAVRNPAGRRSPVAGRRSCVRIRMVALSMLTRFPA